MHIISVYKSDDLMDKEEFIKRLVQLRMDKNISARDMSLSIGQSQNYINRIENGRCLPSMTAFFYICEYFNISPQEFFDTENTAPEITKELLNASKGLDIESMRHIVEVIKRMKR